MQKCERALERCSVQDENLIYKVKCKIKVVDRVQKKEPTVSTYRCKIEASLLEDDLQDKRELKKDQVIRLLECKAVVELSTGCGRWCGIQYGGWKYPI